MMLFLILLFVLIIYLLFKGDLSIPGTNDPDDILDIRLAKGEISIEEYKEIKKASKEN